jgi:hypothetical protein
MSDPAPNLADDTLERLTAAYQTCVKHRDEFSNFCNIKAVYDLLRRPLLAEDMTGFADELKYAASKYPDAFDALMDEIEGSLS